jgi:DNA-binding CsgD family transcriptional regulator
MSYAVEALASAPQIRTLNTRGVDLLSKREREVVTSLASGLSNREIGARLGLSQHTIKNYLLRIFEKLGVSTRVELLSLTLAPEAQRSPIRSFVMDLFDDDGMETPPDISAYRRAAERGRNRAQIKMAELQLLGAGVEKDPIAAYMWYLLAEKTNTEMREKIAADKRKLAETLSTEQILEAQRRASEKLTSEIVEAFDDSTGELHKPPLA